MNILLLDNYDSFTYNLLHILEPLVDRVDVVLNDQLDTDCIPKYDGIVFSPGPGLPAEAGVMPEIIRKYHDRVPMLGVCLGMQGLAEFFGARLYNLPHVLHGVPQTCSVIDPNDVLFNDLPPTFETGHYHSWIVSDVPDCLIITALHKDGWPMSFTHRDFNIRGVQFHPESVMTPHGSAILNNWVEHLKDGKQVAFKTESVV